jgi:hypothetical protein
MQKILAFLQRQSLDLLTIGFFLVLLVVGVVVHRDYGLHWDSWSQYEVGKLNYEFITGQSSALKDYPYRYYGPIFEVLLYSLTSWMPVREMFFTQHLLNFLCFFIGLIFFYFLALDIFKGKRLAFIGCLFIALSPRILADSFYNTKDIPFMSAFIIAVYTLTRLIEKMKIREIFIHSIVSAVLISIRLQGIMILPMTILFLAKGLLIKRTSIHRRHYLWSGLIYLVLAMGLTILFFPNLWDNPLGELQFGLSQLSRFPWSGGLVLYRGQMVSASGLPWHYLPVWVVLTTPVVISILFVIGIFWQGFKSIRNYVPQLFEEAGFLISLLWLIIPLAVVIFLNSVLYDGWRHVFFIYPAYIIIALYGLKNLFSIHVNGTRQKFIQTTILFFVFFGLLSPLSFMIRNHPFENVYFNSLAGSDYRIIKQRYEMDYWGLSYHQALLDVLIKDDSPLIFIKVDNTPGKLNAWLLTQAEQDRISFVEEFEDADYFITNFRWHPDEYDYPLFYSVEVEGVSINSTYRIKN